MDVQSELRAVPSPLLFRRRSSDNTFDEETVVISGPAGFRVTPSGRKTLLLECAELPNEQPGSQLQKYLVRVSGSPAERARGVLEFRVEGVSHETTFSVPFQVIP